MNRRLCVSVLVTVLLAGVGGWAIYVRTRLHVWPFSSAIPQRVHVCGRDYESGGSTATPTSAAAERGGPLERLGTFSPPFGTARPIYGRHYAHPGDECGLAVYIARSHDSYGVYQLLGGP